MEMLEIKKGVAELNITIEDTRKENTTLSQRCNAYQKDAARAPGLTSEVTELRNLNTQAANRITALENTVNRLRKQRNNYRTAVDTETAAHAKIKAELVAEKTKLSTQYGPGPQLMWQANATRQQGPSWFQTHTVDEGDSDDETCRQARMAPAQPPAVFPPFVDMRNLNGAHA